MAKDQIVQPASSLSPAIQSYIDSCFLGRGFEASTLALYLRILGRFSEWIQQPGRSVESVSESVIEGFILEQNHVKSSSLRYRTVLLRMLSFFRHRGLVAAVLPDAVPDPLELLLDRWNRYLLDERGIGLPTIKKYVHFGRFFLSRFDHASHEQLLSQISADSITDFVIERMRTISRGLAKKETSELRCLLRFLHAREGLAGSLDSVVPSVFLHKDSGIPQVLTNDEVERIIEAVGRSPRTRYRNLAVMSLLSQLGLRAQEVASLMIDDIDWRAATILIRGKGGFNDVMPLPPTVGRALAECLLHDTHRGPGDRHLFHNAVGTYGPMTSGGLTGMVEHAAARAGLGPVGPHRFRHTVASRTLNAGASFEEVSQLLRHRSLSSTAVYAKVDFERLRLIVRPWPGPTIMSRDGS